MLDGTAHSANMAPVTSRRATLLVFGTSAAVLVLEILAGRLMAPYVGISLETFTGIIGTVLAGIAAGAAGGGQLADQRDPGPLIGPSLVVGGALAWLSLPIVDALGPQLGNGPASIVILTFAAFFMPAAVLSAVSPMVAKLRLLSLDDTGSVVGGLSASGTVGALAGTFITGFVLVSALPTRPIVLGVGAALVLVGFAMMVEQRVKPPASALVVLLVAGLLTATSVDSPCQHETAYYCVVVVEDPDNASGRDLYLDTLRHAYVDLEDPTVIDIRYIGLFADVAATLPAGPLQTLHLGGGGFSFPRYLRAVRPGGENLVLEIDPELVRINRDELGLIEDDELMVETGDARLALRDLDDDRFDLVVGDAFGSEAVPWHLTTREVISEIDRLLTDDGVYVMNVIDGGDAKFARAELATLRAVFEHVAVIVPRGGVPADRPVNQVLLGSQRPLPDLDPSLIDGVLVTGSAVDDYIDDADVLTDDHAPVDQLLWG